VNCTYNWNAPDMWCPKKLCSFVGSICIHVAFSPHLVNPQHWHVGNSCPKIMLKPWKSCDPYLRKCVLNICPDCLSFYKCTLSTTSLSYSCFICHRRDLHFAHNTAHQT
jgi:hypothetical protein